MMTDLYQSLVAVNPVTLIAQILNLFLQLFIVKHFFLDKVQAILDARREAANRQLTDAENARAEAASLKETYEDRLRHAGSEAETLLHNARRTAAARSEEIIAGANARAERILAQAAEDTAREKQQALHDAKAEITVISLAMAEKVLARKITAADQSGLFDDFLENLEDSL